MKSPRCHSGKMLSNWKGKPRLLQTQNLRILLKIDYVEIVEDIERGDCEVQVSSMHPKGPSTSFFWPERVDEVWVHSSQILCLVDSPNMTSSRGFYSLAAKSSSDIAQAWSTHKFWCFIILCLFIFYHFMLPIWNNWSPEASSFYNIDL